MLKGMDLQIERAVGRLLQAVLDDREAVFIPNVFGHYDKHQLTIMTTTQCNMRCIYCLTNTREIRNISTTNETFARVLKLEIIYHHVNSHGF